MLIFFILTNCKDIKLWLTEELLNQISIYLHSLKHLLNL